jgi:2'-5' RNA ligase
MELENIYNEMKARNNALIEKNGLGHDDKLVNKEDNRYCLALYSTFNKAILTDKYEEFIKIKEFVEHCIYKIDNTDYRHGNLHFTMLQLVGFNFFNFKDSNEMIDEIYKLIKNEICKYLPIKICFNGIIVVPTGIVLKGFPDKNINELRDNIRTILRINNVNIKEPYYNNIVHSTLVRFNHQIDYSEIKKYIENYENVSFGEVIINEFILGHGTWKLNNYELENFTSFTINNLF